jgi:hypothetical protein
MRSTLMVAIYDKALKRVNYSTVAYKEEATQAKEEGDKKAVSSSTSPSSSSSSSSLRQANDQKNLSTGEQHV